METLEELQKRVRKLKLQVVERKLELHDLSEELPLGWETIPEVAQRTYQAFQDLQAAQKQLAELST